MKKHTNLPEEIYHATEKSHWSDYTILAVVGIAIAIIVVEFIFGDAITSWFLSQ
jgi:hypothetical protein